MNNHGSKRTLSAEIVALRKQVNDLKDAALIRRRVEDALRQTGERYRAIVEDAPVALAHVPEARQPLCVNAEFAALLGYSDVAEFRLLGGLREVFETDEDRARLVSRATDAVQRIAIQLRRRDGALGIVNLLVRRSSNVAGVMLAAADPVSDLNTP